MTTEQNREALAAHLRWLRCSPSANDGINTRMRAVADAVEAALRSPRNDPSEEEIARPRHWRELGRDDLGLVVRMAWVEWAREQPTQKPSWLLPYDSLDEAGKEADRRIGAAVAFFVEEFEKGNALPPTRGANLANEQDGTYIFVTPSDFRHPAPQAPAAPEGGGGIYIASKTIHAPRWRALRALGSPIISTWIDEAGQGETACFIDLWRRCIDEAASAERVVVYREPGEVLKGAFIEVGAALARGVPVFAVGCDEFSFVNHRLVTKCESIAAAIASPAQPKESARADVAAEWVRDLEELAAFRCEELKAANARIAELTRERDEARDTNRELHRRLQAVEGPLVGRAEKAERTAAFWFKRRREIGRDRATEHRQFSARIAELEQQAKEKVEQAAAIADAFGEDGRFTPLGFETEKEQEAYLTGIADASLWIARDIRASLLSNEPGGGDGR